MTISETIDVDVVPLDLLPEEIQEQARAFVIDSWVSSYKFFRAPRSDFATYKEGQRSLVLRLMAKADVKIATLPGAPDLFVGWVCRKGEVLHYIYVKQNYRQLGVASKLIEGTKYVSHQPTHSHVRDWVSREAWVYDPYILILGDRKVPAERGKEANVSGSKVQDNHKL